ncbi:hypothetical protein FOZ62_025734 [Perkinsus olseni]|uniref:Uncharacterized protein n=1 Tax=Perkinsus olseni TaxID=32597 RepID=A0A7J6N9D0_PEROL|nr:hypothetical protein FOZ62_025734 [Perkinsus olseni]
MSSSNSQSALRSTGAQTPVDRLNMTLSDIIQMDGIEEPSEPESSQGDLPDGELEDINPASRADSNTPAIQQEGDKQVQEGSVLDGESRGLNSIPKNPLNPDGEPEAAPRIDRKQGQRMSELRKNLR